MKTEKVQLCTQSSVTPEKLQLAYSYYAPPSGLFINCKFTVCDFHSQLVRSAVLYCNYLLSSRLKGKNLQCVYVATHKCIQSLLHFRHNDKTCYQWNKNGYPPISAKHTDPSLDIGPHHTQTPQRGHSGQ